MNLEEVIRETIAVEVTKVLDARLEDFADHVSKRISKPEYQTWGRFLNSTQAKQYVGYSSANGFNRFLRRRGIKPIKINARVYLYDRHELDKLNIQGAIEEYKKNLK